MSPPPSSKTMTPPQTSNPSTTPRLTTPSSPPWPTFPPAPPGSLIPPAPPWSVIVPSPPLDSTHPATPRHSIPPALSGSSLPPCSSASIFGRSDTTAGFWVLAFASVTRSVGPALAFWHLGLSQALCLLGSTQVTSSRTFITITRPQGVEFHLSTMASPYGNSTLAASTALGFSHLGQPLFSLTRCCLVAPPLLRCSFIFMMRDAPGGGRVLL
nr:myb-related transcription factor, partner of profilin-like [Misgurnus anguillicaudatus]